jgi:hypothetical protein
LVAASGSIELPDFQPAIVTGFTSLEITQSTAGASSQERGTTTNEFKHSSNGGSSFGAYQALTLANLRALTLAKNGQDVIRIRITQNAGMDAMGSPATRKIEMGFLQGVEFPKLRRYRLSVPPGLPATTPAFFRQGANVKVAILIPANQTRDVVVDDVNRLKIGDSIARNLNLTEFGQVLDIPSRTKVKIHAGSVALDLQVGDRLVPTTGQPTAYKDSSGTRPYTAGEQIDPTTGVLQPTYFTERFVDVGLSSGPTTRLEIDQPSGATQRVFDIRDYNHDIQFVLDLISKSQTRPERGGIVYIPSGDWPIENQPLRVRGGRITIQGEGQDTRLLATTADEHVIVLEGTDDPKNGVYGVHDFKIQDLQIIGVDQVNGPHKSGIFCQGTPNAANPFLPPGLKFTRVFTAQLGTGIRLEDSVFPFFLDCSLVSNLENGVFLKNVAQPAFYNCHVASNMKYGIYAEGCLGLYFQGPGIESNGEGFDLPDPTYQGQVRLKNCTSCVITRTDIEGYGRAVGPNGIVIEESQGVVVSGCVFLPHDTQASVETTGVRIVGRAGHKSRGVQVVGNVFYGSSTPPPNHLSTGVVVEAASCGDVLLAQNGTPGDGGAGAFTMYKHPTGVAAEGMRLIVSGADSGGGVGAAPPQLGLMLPVGGNALPEPGALNEGMLLYQATARLGHRLKIPVRRSSGIPVIYDWYPVGGVQSFTNNDRPVASLYEPGTAIWDTDAKGYQNSFQVSDGTNWRPLGVIEAFTLAPGPSKRPEANTVIAGTMIWVIDAPLNQNLQISDSAVWKTVTIT